MAGIVGRLTVPVVPEFVLILQPFSLFVTLESEKVISDTTLLLFPPTDPILRPWPPEQVTPVTVTFVPLVTATQSSWFVTVDDDRIMFVVEEISNPSELCAAGFPPLAEFGALPAELSNLIPVTVKPLQPVISKQWTGQFWMFRLEITEFTIFERTIKWSGLWFVLVLNDFVSGWHRIYLAEPPFEPWPSQYASPLPSITWPGAPVMVMFVPPISMGLKLFDFVVPNV
jgi:hypothetical protein